jgi:hypothetical protein
MDLSFINLVRLGGDLNGENFTVAVDGGEEACLRGRDPPPLSLERAILEIWLEVLKLIFANWS